MRNWLMKRRIDLAAASTLALIVIAFFYPLWGQGGWLPYGGGDSVSFLYPMYRFIAASFSDGQIPLWNPHQYAGYPLIADNQSGMFYPVNLVLFLLRPNFGYAWMQVLVGLHLWWAGLGTYMCVKGRGEREMGIVTLAGIFAGVAFMFSDLFITHLGNLNLIAVAAWLPWAVLTFGKSNINYQTSKEEGNVRYATFNGRYLLLTGLIIGISTLAGHGQMTFYIAFTLGLYALWQTVALRDWRPMASLVMVGAIGFGLSALTLLPTYEMNELTRRGAFSYEQTVNYSLPWQGLVGIVAPGFYGRGAQAFWGAWDRVEYGYMGAVAVVLALGTILNLGKLGIGNWGLGIGNEEGLRPRELWFYVGLVVLGLLLALGGNTPVHRAVLGWAQLPFQVPARFVLLMNFGLAMLAGEGIKRLGERRWGDWRLEIGGIGVLVGLVLLRGRYVGHAAQTLQAILIFAAVLGMTFLVLRVSAVGPQVKAVLLIAVLSAELFATSQYIEVDWGNPLAGYQNTAARDFLQSNADINRIDEATGRWQASAAQVDGLYSAGGVFNPLELASHAVLMGSVGYRGSPTYSLLGIKYIVAEKSEPPGDTTFLHPVFDADPNVNIYLNTNALPRAMMLYDSQVVGSQDDAFAALFNDIDFTQTVVLETGETLSGDAAEHAISIVEYGLNRVTIDVDTADRGYLLLTDMWYPHWVATVDGVSAEILRANYGFRAILVEAGQHTVTMQFQPQSWRIGAGISGVSWFAVLLGLFVSKARRRKDAKD